MPKFYPKKSGNKYQKDKITAYGITISIALLKQVGLLDDNGTVAEVDVIAGDKEIIIKAKEAE